MHTERIRKLIENIIERQDYSQRLDKQGDDKFDPLVELINTVLEETEKRGEKIDLLKNSLKEQVAVRTADLEKSNQQLALDKRGAETSSLSKSVFLANLSHELRTPLNHIIGYSEMIQEELEDEGPEALVADIEKIRKASNQLMEWVEEIIDLSKIESGRSELDHQLFSVADLVKEVMKKLGPEAEKAGNVITVDPGDSLGELKGDQERVERVVYNLLENACRATEKGKVGLKIRRETVGETDWLSFAIKDTGAGISPQVMESLFRGI